MRGFAAVLALVLTGCAAPVASGNDGSITLRQTPFKLDYTSLQGLRLLSAVELSSYDTGFGGFSGLLVDDGALTAVSDKGWWLDAKLRQAGDRLTLSDAILTQMRDSAGDPLEKQGGDAEGLTRRGADTLVSFERDHRIMTRNGAAGLSNALHHRAFENFSTNQGLESLATLPDGRLLTIGEQRKKNGYVVYILGMNGILARGWLPPLTRHAPTGADVGPDGKLYVVFRDYSPLLGVSVMIRRFELAKDGLPDPATREDLARFETRTGIDNMEGISLWRDADGRTHLTLISDDNFNGLQRTILVDLEVLD